MLRFLLCDRIFNPPILYSGSFVELLCSWTYSSTNQPLIFEKARKDGRKFLWNPSRVGSVYSLGWRSSIDFILGSGSFGVVFKAIERSTSEVVAIKMVGLPPNPPSAPPNTSQIDLESSEDDIQEIQQEISVLSTCASPFVTQYKASFLRGHKLWIVMEFLGGGSCLDLVRNPFYSLRA